MQWHLCLGSINSVENILLFLFQLISKIYNSIQLIQCSNMEHIFIFIWCCRKHSKQFLPWSEFYILMKNCVKELFLNVFLLYIKKRWKSVMVSRICNIVCPNVKNYRLGHAVCLQLHILIMLSFRTLVYKAVFSFRMLLVMIVLLLLFFCIINFFKLITYYFWWV